MAHPRGMSKRIVTSVALLMALAVAGPAFADCSARYKAKKDHPLKLRADVMQLPERACANRQAAAQYVARQLAREGWTLLSVQSLSGQEDRRKRN